MLLGTLYLGLVVGVLVVVVWDCVGYWLQLDWVYSDKWV